MGYQGRSNYEERDKLFERSMQEKAVDRNQVKKGLEDLFKSKAPAANPCLQGHAWIRDWDGKTKCARCKTMRPASSPGPISPISPESHPKNPEP